MILAARNEVASIGRRVREFAALISDAGLRGEVIVVSDGSTDGTAKAALNAGGELVRVLELPVNVSEGRGAERAAVWRPRMRSWSWPTLGRT